MITQLKLDESTKLEFGVSVTGAPGADPNPAALVAPTGLTSTQSGQDWVFNWDTDTEVDFEIVNQNVETGAEFSRTIQSSNQYTFTYAQQSLPYPAGYGYGAGSTLYKVRKVNRTTLAKGPWAGLPMVFGS